MMPGMSSLPASKTMELEGNFLASNVLLNSYSVEVIPGVTTSFIEYLRCWNKCQHTFIRLDQMWMGQVSRLAESSLRGDYG